MTFAMLVTLALRYLLVVLFFPFSLLDKILNFRGAVGQAKEITSSGAIATGLILVGMAIELFMPIAILTGYADRAAAFVMAGYCMMTALLFKRFWHPGDFWRGGDSQGRTLFWDFLKNFSLAGGFQLITFGTTSAEAPRVLQDPFSSSQPYAQVNQ